MKCSTARERISSLVGGEGTGWRIRQAARHCAHCPACRTRREQAAQITAGLRDLASLPTPPHIRANVFAQLPPISAQENAVQNMRVSLGLEPGAKCRRVAGRLVGGCGALALGGTALLMAAPRVLPGFPSVFVTARNGIYAWQGQMDIAHDPNSLELQERTLAKCQTLRDLWKPWAIQHTTSLRQMLHGGKQGRAAMMQVFEEMPDALPGDGNGLTFRMLQADEIRYSWQPAMKSSMTFRYNSASPRSSAPDTRSAPYDGGYTIAYGQDFQMPQPRPNGMENLKECEKQILRGLNIQYDRQHDIELSCSPGAGRTEYTLWASGRITETTWSGSVAIGREICPPYEELTR